MIPLPYDGDTPIIPDHYCGMCIKAADSFFGDDGIGNVIEAENNGNVLKMDHDAYYGGIVFTGPLNSCNQGTPWYFPIPLSYGGNGPQFGAARLTIQLSSQSSVEFLDHAQEPIEPLDLFDDLEEIPNYEEWLEEVCATTPVVFKAVDRLTIQLSIEGAQQG